MVLWPGYRHDSGSAVVMVVELVGCILVHLQRRHWTRATSGVEDRLVDACFGRPRRAEAVIQQVVNAWVSAS